MPYTGATSNVDLGSNNLLIGNSRMVGTDAGWGNYLALENGNIANFFGGDDVGDPSIYFGIPANFSSTDLYNLYFGYAGISSFQDVQIMLKDNSTVSFVVGDTVNNKFLYKNSTNSAGKYFQVMWGGVTGLYVTPDYTAIDNLHAFNEAIHSFGGGNIAGRTAEICSNNTDFIIDATIKSGTGKVKITADTVELSKDLNVTGNIQTNNSIKGIHKTADGTSAVADGNYVMGLGNDTNGTITIKDGIITSVTEAVN